MARAGRKPKYTDAQAAALFVGATKKLGHVPNSHEFARYAEVSTATAWVMMARLKLRRTCPACHGTGWIA